MDEHEFDVLDELYFVISFEYLFDKLESDEFRPRNVLISLFRKDWVRVYKSMDEGLANFDLQNNFKSYFYLASKKGLLAHNSQ